MNRSIINARRRKRSHKSHTKVRVRSIRPRLVVFRSLNAIYAQIVDDVAQKVLCGTSSLKLSKGIEGASQTGTAIAKLALAKKVKEVAFDRNGYKYHGRVKALADAAREAGLSF